MADDYWRARYEDKRTTVQGALSHIRKGDRIFIGAGCGEPQALIRGLAEMGGRLADSDVYHLLTLGTAPYTAPRFSNSFRHNSFFIGHDVRSDVAEGRADYTPVFLSEVSALFTQRHIPVDVAIIQISPPDDHGTCSYGVAVDITKPAAESARVRIAQVNRLMPRTLGDSFIHGDQLDAIVELDEPILTVPLHETTDITREIGRQVAKLVEDGCCLQVGIGSVTGAMLDHLHGRRDLGLHTEMFTDAVIDLVSEGVINNARKTLHRGKIVASFCMGTPRLYDFVHDNPMCEFRPSDYTNDPYVIGQNDKMVAVNAALEIDLTGQVCSDSLGYDFYSGIGGQVDFMRGAARSRGGKPVICLSSEAAEGRSRIVPHLSEGAGVVTTRGGVHYVVTEYGIAYLHGKSIRERAMALIQVAHPDHRAELLAHAKERHYVFMDQAAPRSERYPDELERHVTLEDGGMVLFRPLRPTDDALVRDLFYDTSENAVYKRFMNAKATFPRDERDAVVNIDYRTTMSLAAARSGPGADELVALAEWRLGPDDDYAEVAFMVRDDWQHRGLGMRLLNYLIELGMQRGLGGFKAEVLVGNQGMLHVFQQCSQQVKIKLVDGAYEVLIDFDADGAGRLRAAAEPTPNTGG